MYSGQLAKFSSAEGVSDAAGASDAPGAAESAGALDGGAALGAVVPWPLAHPRQTGTLATRQSNTRVEVAGA